MIDISCTCGIRERRTLNITHQGMESIAGLNLLSDSMCSYFYESYVTALSHIKITLGTYFYLVFKSLN